MTRRFRKILSVSAALLSAWAFMASGHAAAASADPIQLETFKTHSRLSLRVEEGVTSEWKSTPQGFELILKGIGLNDLGAPLGDESRWAEPFRRLRDPRIEGLELAEVPGGLAIRGKWRYPAGDAAPAIPVMESFDYRDKAQSAWVVDFWVKEGPTVAELRKTRAAARNLASARKREADQQGRALRRETRRRALVQAEDPALFCRTPLSEENDVFLQLQPFHEPVDFARWIPSPTPDAAYSYREPQGKERDAQYFRLALRLYREGNLALAVRTLDFMDEEHPSSPHRSETRFLRANALLKLGHKAEAERLLRDSLHDRAAAPSTLPAALYLLGGELQAGNHLAALETLTWLSKHHGKSPLNWVFHLGAAESARALRQTERAAQEYEWVAEHAPDAVARSEGALRAGDLYLERAQFDQALAAYAQGLRHFKEEAEGFPAVHLNRAEALYQLGQLDRAAEGYRSFLDRFPAHPRGWRAAYRLGEIEARRPGATRESGAARKWFLETINRFPMSPGATLARMQLMSCGDRAGFNADATRRFFGGEAEAFDGAGEILMDRYRDFRALSRVRALMTLGLEQEAVSTAIDELKRVVRIEARRWLGSLLAMSFRKTILAHLGAGRKLEALAFYEKHEGSVPRTESRVDPDYLMKLSQAASDLGLGKLAQEIQADYEKTRKVSAASGRGLASGGPQDPDDTESRLLASERAFTEAKALWIAGGSALGAKGKGKGAEETERRLRVALNGIDAESRFSREREIILGLLEERQERIPSALRHAARAQLLGPRDARVDAWVASLEARAGDSLAALSGYRALEKLKPSEAKGASAGAAETLGVPAAPAREALILAECEILEKLGRWGEAAANYSRAVEEGIGGGQARYGYARALLRSGGPENRARALRTLAALVAEGPQGAQPQAGAASPDGGGAAPKAADEKDRFWRRLASETLANEKTRDDAKEGMRQ